MEKMNERMLKTVTDRVSSISIFIVMVVGRYRGDGPYLFDPKRHFQNR